MWAMRPVIRWSAASRIGVVDEAVRAEHDVARSHPVRTGVDDDSLVFDHHAFDRAAIGIDKAVAMPASHVCEHLLAEQGAVRATGGSGQDGSVAVVVQLE
jgi:hypothetical protein